MAAVSNSQLFWMDVEKNYTKPENYDPYIEQTDQERRCEIIGDKNRRALSVTKCVTTSVTAAAIGSALIPVPGSTALSIIGAAFTGLVTGMVKGVINEHKRAEDRRKEKAQQVIADCYVQGARILTKHFQGSERFVCSFTTRFPKDPVRIKGEDNCYERDFLVEHASQNNWTSPKTNNKFTMENIVFVKEFHTTIGKMCNVFLQTAQKVNAYSLRQLQYVEELREECKSVCKNRFSRVKQEYDRQLKAKEIDAKTFHRNMLALHEEFDPEVGPISHAHRSPPTPRQPSDEEKQ